jgi:hypothetical protein
MDDLDEDVRRAVAVGSMMRVLAPLVERTTIVEPEYASTARDAQENAADAATSMMMSAPDAAMSATEAAMPYGDSAERERRSKKDSIIPSYSERREERRELLREACAFVSRGEQSEATKQRFKDCVKRLKNSRVR